MLWGILGAYLLGSIPTAYLFGKLRGQNLGESGSGNLGALNAARVLGKVFFIPVFLLDVGKGILAVFIGRTWLGGIELPMAAAVLLGHNYSIYFLGRKGGRGLATAAGVLLMLSPLLTAMIIATMGIGLLLLREAHLAAVGGLVLVPLLFPVFLPEAGWLWGLLLSGIILSRHIEPIWHLWKARGIE